MILLRRIYCRTNVSSGEKNEAMHISQCFFTLTFVYLFFSCVDLSFFFRGIWSAPSGKAQPWEQLELFSGAACSMPAQRSVRSVCQFSGIISIPLVWHHTLHIYLYQCHQSTRENDGSALLSGLINSVRLKSPLAPKHIALGRSFVAQWNNESR